MKLNLSNFHGSAEEVTELMEQVHEEELYEENVEEYVSKKDRKAFKRSMSKERK